MSALSRLSVLAWIGLAAAGAMVIGSFGPWAKAVGLLNLSISGTDGANDGWLVVGAAVVGAAALVLYDRAYAVGRSGVHLASALGVLLAGAGGAAVTIYDRGNVTDAANENTGELVFFQVGWGLNLAMGASIVLGVVGLIALFRGFDAPGVITESEGQRVASSPNASETQSAVTQPATISDISELADLHSRGALTDEEFRLAKESMLARLTPTTTPSVQTPEPPSTTSLSEGGSTTHREPSPVGPSMTSGQTDNRRLYGGVAAVIITVAIAIALIVVFTGDNGSGHGNTSCPPGQTMNDNGYCSSP